MLIRYGHVNSGMAKVLEPRRDPRKELTYLSLSHRGNTKDRA